MLEMAQDVFHGMSALYIYEYWYALCLLLCGGELYGVTDSFLFCSGSAFFLQVDPAIGEAGDIDTSLAMLTFANGVVVTVDNSRKATYGYDQRVEIFGSKVRAGIFFLYVFLFYVETQVLYIFKSFSVYDTARGLS